MNAGMIWSPSPTKEIAGPDVQPSALELNIGLAGNGTTMRKLWGGRVSEAASDRSNTPPAQCPRGPPEETAEDKAADREGGGLSPEGTRKAPGVEGKAGCRVSLFLPRPTPAVLLQLHRRISGAAGRRTRPCSPPPPSYLFA